MTTLNLVEISDSDYPLTQHHILEELNPHTGFVFTVLVLLQEMHG